MCKHIKSSKVLLVMIILSILNGCLIPLSRDAGEYQYEITRGEYGPLTIGDSKEHVLNIIKKENIIYVDTSGFNISSGNTPEISTKIQGMSKGERAELLSADVWAFSGLKYVGFIEAKNSFIRLTFFSENLIKIEYFRSILEGS